jgi:hypothetical protein
MPAEVKSSQDKISVCIRIRPLNERELKTGSPSSFPVWRVANHCSLYQCNAKTGAALPNSPIYSFDYVYDDSVSTLLIYKQVSQRIVHGAVEGYNGTIFAYGQTSSGKTHTMKGSREEPGIIPQSVFEVFNMIRQTMDREFIVRVSYMEIYNEVIMDLLEPENKNLKIHEDLQKGIFVGNLKEQVVTSPEQVLELMDNGERYRHFGSTNMNERSSRSHTIFRLVIESRRRHDTSETDNRELDESDAVRVATLNLVDLAGSERAQHTGAEGHRLVEGGHINKSLLTLGTVISKLSEGSAHIPYRDSKLTRILQTALGGNSRTAIICTITPAAAHNEETLSTLKFASRAKIITNQTHINEIINDQNLIQKLKREASEWKQKYKEQLELYELLGKENDKMRESVDKYEALIVSLQEKVSQMEEQNSFNQDIITKLKEELQLHIVQEISNREELSNIKQLYTSNNESTKTHYENLLEKERRNFDLLSQEQLQKCLELEKQADEIRNQAQQQLSENDKLYSMQLRAQAEQFEKEKNRMLEAFEKEKLEILKQASDTEKELQARIDELEQEKNQFVIDNTGTYEKVNALQKDMNTLKSENEELRMKLQKRKRRANNSTSNTADNNKKNKLHTDESKLSEKRICLGVLQENILKNSNNR